MFLDYDNGGLRAPSAETLTKSLELSRISRLIANDQTSVDSWKVIPNYLFQ